MDRRRALLAGGYKGLPIYKKGAASWLNVEEAVANRTSVTATFNSDNVAVKTGSNAGNSYYYYLKISQNVYGEYSNLVFKAVASAIGSNTSIIWATSKPAASAPPSGEKTMLTTSVQEYSVDISGESGDRYILIFPNVGNGAITIYDMHFE